MNFNICRHLPITTNRIEFRFVKSAGPLPAITPRIDFGSDCPKGDELLTGAGDLESGSRRSANPRPEAQVVAVATPAPEEPLSELSELDSPEPDEGFESEEEISYRERSTKIPKPRGEPGRPGSGPVVTILRAS